MLNSLSVLLEALFFIYLCYLAGDAFFRFAKIELKTTIQNQAYRLLSGYGIFGLISFALGSMGFFNARTLWFISLLIVFLSHETVAKHFNFLVQTSFKAVFQKIGTQFKDNTFLKIIISIWIAANLIIVFVPITGHDTLDYHLPIMKNINTTGTVTYTPAIEGYPHLPVLGEIIYAAPIALFNETSAPYVFQVLQYSLLVLIILIIYDFASRRVKIPFLGFAAVFGAMAVMDFEREIMHGGYVDILAFLFGIASILLMIEYAAESKFEWKPVALSAFLVGIGASIKYPALFMLGTNGLILLYVLIRDRFGWKKSIGYLLLYTAIFTAVACPWYIKNYEVFDNPVYPMFTNKETTAQVGLFVRERTVPNMIVFPFYKFSQWFFHEKESSSQLILLGYFILLYLLILWMLIRRIKWTRAELILFLFVQTYFWFIFFVSHQNRFMIPSLILIPTLLAFFIDRIYEMLRHKLKTVSYTKFMRGSYILLCTAFFLVLLGNFHYFYVKWKYIAGITDKKAYVIEIGGM